MKRIVVLIDGTWGKEGTGADTNVAKLDSGNKIVTQAFTRPKAADGTVQNVHYHDGVGAEGDILQKAPWWGHRSRAEEDYPGGVWFCGI